MITEKLGLAKESFHRAMLKGRAGTRGVYVSRATDIDWRDTVSEAEEKRERSTILCNIYPSYLLIYLALLLFPLMLLPPPLMTSPFYPRCERIPIYHPTLLRASSSFHLPLVLSISVSSFLRYSYGL